MTLATSEPRSSEGLLASVLSWQPHHFHRDQPCQPAVVERLQGAEPGQPAEAPGQEWADQGELNLA